MNKIACYICCLFLLLSTQSLAGSLIKTVRLVGSSNETGVAMRSAAGKEAASKEHTLSWHLTYPGRVSVYICDLQGNIVRSFRNGEQTGTGDFAITWDGTDDSGALCAAGLYFPVIRILTRDMGVETYNPTALPWGEEILPDDINYDSSGNLVTYTLSRAALVRIRAGEKDGGPLYTTITDWVLRPAGSHAEPWDGLDATGHFQVTDREKFNIAFDAFSVPENSIMLNGPASATPAPKTAEPSRTFPVFPPNGGKLAYFLSLPHGLLPDLGITAVPTSFVRKNKGIYHVKGKVPIRVSLSRGALAHNPEEGIELYLYVDGRMIHEGPAESLPADVNMDTRKFSNGKHLVTLNLRTSDDRAASFSMEVSINN